MGRARWKQATTSAALAGVISIAPAAVAEPAATSCSLSGEARLSRNVELYDEATGGDSFAKFTGSAVELTASAFPSSPSGRARVSTSGFQLDGYVSVTDIPVYTRRSIPVVSGHIWIGAHRDVGVIGARSNELKIKKKLSYPLRQTFQTWTPCDALTLTEQVARAHQPSGHARAYVLKQDSLELFSGAAGASVTTVHRSPSASGVLFYSTERESSWVHVQHHGEVVLDAWARSRDLSALPPGETMDQLLPSTLTKRGTPRLKLQGDPRVVKATKPVTIRGRASDDGPKIGRIATGTVVYVVDVVAGWASVMPKDLSITPAGGAQFWVASDELEE